MFTSLQCSIRFSSLALNRSHVMFYSSIANKGKSQSLRSHDKYDEAQEKKILDVINHRPISDLDKFSISKSRLKRIEMFRQKQGVFKNLDDILELDGFGEVVLEKFCDSILTKSNEVLCESIEKPTKDPSVESQEAAIFLKKQSFVSPVLSEITRKKISSVVAIQVDLRYISWTKLSLGSDNSIVTEDWNCMPVGVEDKKMSLSDLIQLLLFVNQRIPSADVYVLEALQAPQAAKQPGSVLQVNVNVQRSQLVAMMGMLMASRNSTVCDDIDTHSKDDKNLFKSQQSVFFLRTFLSSRLYKTYVGSERVSTETAIQEILSKCSNFIDHEENSKRNSIEISYPFQEIYREESRITREYLGQSMLIGLTFIKLCVLKCRESTAMLNLRNRKLPAVAEVE